MACRWVGLATTGDMQDRGAQQSGSRHVPLSVVLLSSPRQPGPTSGFFLSCVTPGVRRRPCLRAKRQGPGANRKVGRLESKFGGPTFAQTTTQLDPFFPFLLGFWFVLPPSFLSCGDLWLATPARAGLSTGFATVRLRGRDRRDRLVDHDRRHLPSGCPSYTRPCHRLGKTAARPGVVDGCTSPTVPALTHGWSLGRPVRRFPPPARL